MIRFLGLPPVLLCLALMPPPASAQMSPPPGVLTLPRRQPSVPEAPVTPPQPAPVTPVEQVAPFASPPTAAPAKPYVAAPNAPAQPATPRKPKQRTPIVQAPPNVHAQRPPGASAAAAKPAIATAVVGKPAPPPAAAVPSAAPARATEAHGSVTNLPLPRWAALRADEVNLRVGPGLRFPIDWQYRRRDLPVKILREVEVWRLVQDQDGVKGWVHQATLTGRRSLVVTPYEATLRAAASDEAAPVARLKAGVIGRIRLCEAGAAWCEVQVADYRGFLRRNQFFGTEPGEAVGN
jgi:SH3-like domain-containing protein